MPKGDAAAVTPWLATPCSSKVQMPSKTEIRKLEKLHPEQLTIHSIKLATLY